MGILGRLFGTDEAIKSGVEVISKGLDALVYTDEEKAQDHAKTVTEARSMMIAWMEASQGQKLSRRIISLAITFTWLAMYIASMLLAVFGETVSANIVGEFADSMNGAVMLILAFYFAAPHIGDVIKPAMEKFSKKPNN